jgi:curved DNA-binding protein CbpA
METYYSLLGIPSAATDAEIKSAYRKLAKQFHPDANPQVTDAVRRATEEKFKEVQEAYDVLRNSSKRALYDRLLASQFPRQAPPTPQPRPVRPAQYQGPPVAHSQKNDATMLTRMAIFFVIACLRTTTPSSVPSTTPSSVPSWIRSWTPSVALHEEFGQIDKNHGYPILADNGAKFCVKENPEGLDVIVNRSKTDGGYTIVHDTAEGFKSYSTNASVVDIIGAQFDVDGTYCQGNSVGGISLAASATQFGQENAPQYRSRQVAPE